MSPFASLRGELVAEVFDLWGTDASRTGYPLPFRCVLRVDAGDANGVSYEQTTARIYNADAALANGEQIIVNNRIWEIDGIADRDALTITFNLRAT